MDKPRTSPPGRRGHRFVRADTRPNAEALLSVRESAARAETTERTIRRWIAAGKLAAGRTAAGWAVRVSDLDALLAGHAPGHADTPDGQDADTRTRGQEEAPHLAALVRDLQQQNLELAGRIGFYQAQIEQLRALPPPAPRRPWWRFWAR